MTIEKIMNGSTAVLKITDMLDTETAPELEALIDSELAGVDDATAREALRLASHKLPVKCKFVKKEEGEQ